jgi:hypothetical protein
LIVTSKDAREHVNAHAFQLDVVITREQRHHEVGFGS